VLHAAEWPIYGRFGYGPATFEGNWTLRTRAARLIPEPWGSMEMLTPAEARPVLPEVFARHVAGQAGAIERRDYYWDVDLGLIEVPSRTRWKGQVAIHRDAAGTPDGYVRFSGEEHWVEGIPDNIAKVDDLVGASPEAELELWRFLASLDLVATVKAESRRVNEPWRWALADARAAQMTRANDGLWLRPYDVPALLGARTYGQDADLVIEIADRLGDGDGPAAGRYRLETGDDGASCRPTGDAPDLTIPAAALGAAVLGGTRLVDATRAGGAVEHRPGALLEADRLLRATDEPWCSTFF
jgi:predicted acetyltransferase